MASALNRRLDQPHFGPFAITPRRLAARRREQAEDRLAFLELIQTADLNWKEASHAVGNILQCWEYQGTANAVLDYEQFATTATHTAVDCIGEMDTTSKRLTEYTIDADTSVAVVGFKQLTELERSILPSDYETVDPFTEESFNYPPSEFSTHRLRSSTPSSIRSHRRTPTTWLSSSMQPVSTHRSSSRRWKLQTFHITVVLASPTIRHTERSYNFSDTHTLVVEILVWVTSDHYSSSSDWWWISSMTRNDSVISMCPKSSGCSNSAQRHRSSYPRLGTRQVRDSYWKFAGRLPRGTRAAWNSRRHRHRAGGRPPRVLSSVVRGPHRP